MLGHSPNLKSNHLDLSDKWVVNFYKGGISIGLTYRYFPEKKQLFCLFTLKTKSYTGCTEIYSIIF
ncbi:MAG: hypothetical protein D3922_08515 [Candidatus Electrothrix sp. AR1]|nr:hypothetical protein [Candidatus Electrothrix sp. AR1]